MKGISRGVWSVGAVLCTNQSLTDLCTKLILLEEWEFD